MIDYVAFGRNIKASRQKKGLTQEQLAELVGIGPSHMSHIESGKTVPSFEVFVMLVNALDTSADVLLCKEIKTAKPHLSNWLVNLVADCNATETKIISDTIMALKDTLRRNKREYFDD